MDVQWVIFPFDANNKDYTGYGGRVTTHDLYCDNENEFVLHLQPRNPSQIRKEMNKCISLRNTKIQICFDGKNSFLYYRVRFLKGL